MPLTIRTSNNPPREWKQPAVRTSRDLLQGCLNTSPSQPRTLFHSSFPDTLRARSISHNNNGFVNAAFEAYCQHHHLVLRPEDVWFAVLTQLSFYVNAHAEELRSVFVAHDGQKEVTVSAAGTIHTVDIGALAVELTTEMDRHIVDEGLRAWILPDFSTTEPSDLVTAAVIMMGTMQKYFSYGMELTCGIPSVTLLGDRDDWVRIRRRLDDGGGGGGRLDSWGDETALFAARLRTVLDYFVRSFDAPEDPQVLEFWGKIAHHEDTGSGLEYLSGWITAFCHWDAEGKQIQFDEERNVCRIDGTLYSTVYPKDVPNGFVSVPVKVDDNGTEYNTKMVAGSVGIAVSSSGEFLDESRYVNFGGPTKSVGTKTGPDTLQPVSGWWMYDPESGKTQHSQSSASQEPGFKLGDWICWK